MNAEVRQDPFAGPPEPLQSQQDIEAAWFAAPRQSSRPLSYPPRSPSQVPPPPPIDDPVADVWFR